MILSLTWFWHLGRLIVWVTTNWKILRERGIPDHLTCLLRNLYADQEATAKTRHGTVDWFKIGKGIQQGCIMSPSLFNLHGESILWNVRLDDSQARIKIARGNINYLRNADDTTLMTESEKELRHSKPLLTWDLESRGWYNGKTAAIVVENIVSQYTLLPVSCVILGKSLLLSGPWISILNNNEEWKSCLETQHSKH